MSHSTTPSGGQLLPVNTALNRQNSNVDPQLKKAAQGMESMFLDYMMQVMRKTIPKSEMSLDNSATEIYQGMLDAEISKNTAKNSGIGLAQQIIDYYMPTGYNNIRALKDSKQGTGGPNESRLQQSNDSNPRIGQE